RSALSQQTLSSFSEKDVRAAQALDQLGVAFLRQVKATGWWRILVAHPVEPAAQAINAVGIAVGVLVAVIAIVPVENVETAIWASLLRDGHEPGVVRVQEIRSRLSRVR